MSRNRQIGVEPPTKRAKLENKPGYKFTSADEIRRSLRTHDQDSLIEGARIILSFQGIVLTGSCQL